MQHAFRRLPLSTLTTLSLLVPASVFAQDTTRLWSHPNAIKTNLLAPVSVFYERALTRRFALRTSVRAFSGRLVFEKSRFVNATIEGRIYTARRATLRTRDHPTGLFVNPYLKARSLRYVERIGYGFNKAGDLDEIIVNSLGCGLTIGYQWVNRRGFVVEVFHGQGRFYVNNSRHTLRYGPVTSSISELIRIDFRSGISLGYAF